MYSPARQSVHYVGRATYYIGDAGKTIDQVNWATKAAHHVDGEDIAAAQEISANGKHLILGWIPHDALGNYWGGTLSLPRELTARADGTLDVKLDAGVAQRTTGAAIWPGTGGGIVGSGNGWSVTGLQARYTGTGFATAALPFGADQTSLTYTVNMDAQTTRSGLLVGQSVAGPLGIEVTLDKQNNLLRIRHDATGAGGWVDYASTEVRAGELSGNVKVHVLMEGNMIELFVNDSYSLAARVETDLTGADVRLLTVSPLVRPHSRMSTLTNLWQMRAPLRREGDITRHREGNGTSARIYR
jgi:sucrose-6-phosphate hydrolase SacC (GH32 family)